MAVSYPWKNLSPKDGYIVSQTALLSDIDQRVLTSLYQPVIGASAYSLYMTLRENAPQFSQRREEVLVAELLAVLSFGIADFYQSRVRLEAVGLLRTYKKKDSEHIYLYELHPPLSAVDFFADDVISLLLLERVGEKTYQSLRAKFSVPSIDKQDYREVTQSFLDVFQFNPTTEQHNQLVSLNAPFKNALSVSSESKPRLTIQSDSFDWDFFYNGLNKHFVKKESVNTEAKRAIFMLHEMYGIDELQMQQYVLEACDVESGVLDIQKLKTNAHRTFHNQNDQKIVVTDKVQTVLEEEQNQYRERKNQLRQDGFSSGEIAVIESSEENRPMAFLQSIKEQKNGFVTRPEQWTLEEILSQSKLPASVVNILIHYILVVKNSPVFDRNLAYKIANDWAQQNISSPEEAMKKVKELRQATKARYNNTQKGASYGRKQNYSQQNKAYRKETLPDWARDDQPEKKEQRLSEEEQKAFRERLKKIRSYRKEGDQ